MKQIVQNLKNGETTLIEVPSPELSSGELLIHSRASLISAGTERMLIDFGKANYFTKARQQPEKVKEVISKIKTDGLATTYEAVQSKLSQPIPLGYCNVGEIAAVGSEVQGFSVGDRIVSNGNHSEVVAVPKNLCAKIPDNVSDEEATFVVLGAIALQGIRLAKPTLGEKIVVIGLGVIGLLAVQILRANGCSVLAIDIKDDRLKLAEQFGAVTVNPNSIDNVLKLANNFSKQRGVDAVIITASTSSDEIISQSAKMCRKRGRIILVGVTGLNLSRDDFYKKELSFQVSCSYGPGRYDPDYEEYGNDYPLGFVRWTEQRNFEAVLDLMAAGKINTTLLVSHRSPFEEASNIYKLISSGEQGLGMILQYSTKSSLLSAKTVVLPQVSIPSELKLTPISIGFIGAGNYASRILMPAFKALGVRLHTVVTLTGLSGSLNGTKLGFEFSSTDKESVLDNQDIDTIVIATKHNTHSNLVCRSLKAGKHVFVEKPLSIDKKGLNAIQKEYLNQKNRENNKYQKQLMVGFNRRFSAHIVKMIQLLSTLNEPKSLIMTMNAGFIPKDHWVHDSKVGGGRIIGEACHYIDLMRHIVGEKIISVNAQSMGQKVSGKFNDDNVVITLGFMDGSFGTINYLSNGSNAFPKENIQVFCAGRVLSLENFRVLKGYGWPKFKSFKTWRQDKGQKECIKSFLTAINANQPAIHFNELFEVASISLEVAKILRQKK